MSHRVPVTDPRLSWIPPLEDQPVRRSHKRKATPWTASRSASTAGTTLDQPTEADVKRELALLRQDKAQYEAILETRRRVEVVIKGVNDRIRHNQIKAANRRLREAMANYRHKPAQAVPGDLEARREPLLPTAT
jgi:hypothetical protein